MIFSKVLEQVDTEFTWCIVKQCESNGGFFLCSSRGNSSSGSRTNGNIRFQLVIDSDYYGTVNTSATTGISQIFVLCCVYYSFCVAVLHISA